MSSHDPFSESFDSISIEHAHASVESISASFEALSEDGPGFYLLDDAHGRFIIDREMGVVSLAHPHLMAVEAGAIHGAHIKVIEPSGATYELRLRLKLTGRIPQIVGADEDNAIAALAAPPPAPAAPVSVLWSEFAAFRATANEVQRLWGEYAPFGTLLDAPPLAADITEPGELSVATLPAPSSLDAIWDF